eukprot:TRINITY_DN3533_c0_g1_i1.p1 TRINITY_DN3533_c0_g1~~TRINITY_DN3533_c0_g1_i1.p1  ORF type:complete len:451 (-),score=37.73 TRINITY_DN3533_c0_g1_i1:327-1679(-)
MAGPSSGTYPWSKTPFMSLYGMICCFHTATGLVDPVMWQLMVEIGFPDPALFGWLYGIGGLLGLVSSAATGWLMQRFSTKVLLSGMFFLAALHVPLTLLAEPMHSVTPMIVGSVISGLSGGVTAVIPVYLMEHTTVTNRNQELSTWYVAWTVGSLVGPLVTAGISQCHGWNLVFFVVNDTRTPFHLSLLVGILALVLCWTFFPNHIPRVVSDAESASVHTNQHHGFGASEFELTGMKGHPAPASKAHGQRGEQYSLGMLIMLTAQMFAVETFCHALYMRAFPELTSKLKWTPLQLSLLNAAIGLFTIPCLYFLEPATRFVGGDRPLLWSTLVLLMAGTFLQSDMRGFYLPSSAAHFLGLLLVMCVIAVYETSHLSYFSKVLEHHPQSSVWMGVYQGVYGLTVTSGSVLSGYLDFPIELVSIGTYALSAMLVALVYPVVMSAEERDAAEKV